MRLIHYSPRIIESLEDRPYYQEDLSWQAKPNGLWISVEGDKLGENWKEWCETEEFCVENLKHSYEILLKEDARILHLKTPEEIFEFTKKYPLRIRGWDADSDTYQLEWFEVKKKYQGIIISPYQWPCRLSLESCWYYGWDCSSGCIWDLKCIDKFTLVNS